MRVYLRIALLGLAAWLQPTMIEAGSFVGIDRHTRAVPSNNPTWVPPYAIVHPMGFNGTGGLLIHSICIPPTVPSPDRELLVPSLQSAISIWNSFRPRYGNCFNCRVTEDGPPAEDESYSVMSVLLHEIGHCVMGLGHTNLVEVDLDEANSSPTYWRTGSCDVDSEPGCGTSTSVTANAYSTAVTTEAGGIPGDFNDIADNTCDWDPAFSGPEGSACNCCSICPGPDCPIQPLQVEEVAWFRRLDNDPIVIDDTVIHQATFSRSQVNLPAGSSSAANANRLVAGSVGHPGTQSVMYTPLANHLVYAGLSADDVNMVRMGMTGTNRVDDSSTGDDYAVLLSYEENCTNADVEVLVADISPALGGCSLSIGVSFEQFGARLHYSVFPPLGEQKLFLVVTSDLPVLRYDDMLFWDSFETDDFREWSETSGAPRQVDAGVLAARSRSTPPA